jgi:RNA polymerase sigma factor (sigma-70 family)
MDPMTNGDSEPWLHQPSGWQEDWIQRAREGDQTALEELYRSFRGEVVGYVTRHMGAGTKRWSEPEDLAEEVLLEVLGRPSELPEGIDRGRLKARLLRTAGSRIKDLARKFQRHAGISVIPVGSKEAGVSQHSVSRHESQELMRGLVDRLPDEYREIVRLCGLEEMSYVEASRRLDMSEDTVRKRYERAREVLAKKLIDRGYGR